VIRLKPNQFIHFLDNNSNVVEYLVGPATFTRKDHQVVLFQPRPCIALAPRTYCRIKNPVARDAQNNILLIENTNQVRVRLGDEEIRLHEDYPEPFPLLPGEILVDESKTPIKPLLVLRRDAAIKLRAERAFTETVGDKSIRRNPGDVWLFPGPGTYVPRIEVKVEDQIQAHVIKPNTALQLSALVDFVDRNGTRRVVGEEWLIRKEGAYLPAVEEKIGAVVDGIVLTEKTALHLEARRSFVDHYGIDRKAGEQWLVYLNSSDARMRGKADVHIPDVHEKVVNGEVNIVTLTNRQYCVVLDPVDEKGHNLMGKRDLRKGELSFFLQPGERLRNGVEDVRVLSQDQALLLRADEAFDDAGTARTPGEKWMKRGPCDYIPPPQVSILDELKAIPLDENEGVYIRNKKKGSIRAHKGSSVMLTEDEVLWEKEMPTIVDELLACPNGSKHMRKDPKDAAKGPGRVKSAVVRFNVQHNAAVQIYDYQNNVSRVVHGPQVVMLEPEEQFTVLALSGGKPKEPNIIKSLQLFKGPDFMSDEIMVETADHARLKIALSYNWKFEPEAVTPGMSAEERIRAENLIFSVPDFVGDACKAMASRIRGYVAAESFEEFHKNSARIIRMAVFGQDATTGKIRDRFTFSANRLVITNVDIKSIEPHDPKTRASLQQSVQLAIEITTKSQEAEANHKKNLAQQIAKGQLELQKLTDAAKAEEEKKKLLQMQAASEAIRVKGEAIAEAQARAEGATIKAQSELEQAKLKAKAHQLSKAAEIEQLKAKQLAQIEYTKRMNELEIKKAKELADIESDKLAQTMDAIGKETLLAIAKAGPEMQAELLQGLGLKGYLITDGNSPINLFNTAQGMVGMPAAAAGGK